MFGNRGVTKAVPGQTARSATANSPGKFAAGGTRGGMFGHRGSRTRTPGQTGGE